MVATISSHLVNLEQSPGYPSEQINQLIIIFRKIALDRLQNNSYCIPKKALTKDQEVLPPQLGDRFTIDMHAHALSLPEPTFF